MRTTRATKTGGILLEVDSTECVNTLAEKVKQVVAGKVRVTRLKRPTPILLLDVLNWAERADVREGLTTASNVSQDLDRVAIKDGYKSRRYGSMVITVPCNVAIQLAEPGAVVIGWTRCCIRLHERSSQNASAAKAQGT